MKQTLIATLLMFPFLTVQARMDQMDVIYGVDNRKDIFEVKNSLQLTLAKSTAGMISKTAFARATSTTFEIKQQISLERGQNVCASEKFSAQYLAPSCSGFLVGPDILVTAGHCYLAQQTAEAACANYAWVFDYNMNSASHNPTKNISINNIYTCKKVISAKFDKKLDFAIIKLDRKVVGRAPLKFRASEKIATSAPLVVIGHPSGLPTKISDGGKVNHNSVANSFSTNLDTFHGNSGSAVFDSKTGQLEGILVMGKDDYQPSKPSDAKSCMVVNKCDDNGNKCTAGEQTGPVAKGEVVLRITTISSKIQAALLAK